MLATSKEDFESACRIATNMFNDCHYIKTFALMRKTDPHGQVSRQLFDSCCLGLVEGAPQMIDLQPPQFVEMMRQVAASHQADLYMLISEATMGMVPFDWACEDPQAAIKQAEQQIQQAGGIDKIPGSHEIVLIHLEDLESCEIWMANIIRGDKTARLTEFRPLLDIVEGKMTRVLPHPQQANCN